MLLELTDEQRAFRESVRQFAETEVAPRAADLDTTNRFPHDLVRQASARGLMGVTIPTADSGAAAKDTQERCTSEAAMAKLYASEAAHRAADRTMQIFAAEGYRRGSTAERLVRDVRATEIYQGTSEVQRMVIAASEIAQVQA